MQLPSLLITLVLLINMKQGHEQQYVLFFELSLSDLV